MPDIEINVTPQPSVEIDVEDTGPVIGIEVQATGPSVSIDVTPSGPAIELNLTQVESPQIELVVSQAGATGPAGVDVSHIIGEFPVGAIDGSNATFITTFEFVPGTVQVYVNGVRQQQPVDFNTSGMQTILLAQSPKTGEIVLVDYILN